MIIQRASEENRCYPLMSYRFQLAERDLIYRHSTDLVAHTHAFVTPSVEYRVEREIALPRKIVLLPVQNSVKLKFGTVIGVTHIVVNIIHSLYIRIYFISFLKFLSINSDIFH